MKRIVTLLFTVLATLAVADPGTYQGSGTWTHEGKDVPYEVRIQVKAAGNNVFDDVETTSWKDETGTVKSMQIVISMAFTDGRHFQVLSNGKPVGQGYCGLHAADKWCDYHFTYNGYAVHLNLYYNAATKTLYRMGDLNDGTDLVVETLKKLD